MIARSPTISFILVMVICLFSDRGLSDDDFGIRPIPVVYGKAFAIVDSKTKEVIVVQGVSDPVLFSSRATFFFWRFESLPAMSKAMKSQHDNGPMAPNEINKDSSKIITVEASKTSTVRFSAFSRNFSWNGGNEKIGWLKLKDNKNTMFLDLTKETTDFEYDDSHAIPLDGYIRDNTERIVQENMSNVRLGELQ